MTSAGKGCGLVMGGGVGRVAWVNQNALGLVLLLRFSVESQSDSVL